MGETLAETRVEIEARRQSSRGPPPSFATPSTSESGSRRTRPGHRDWRGRRLPARRRPVPRRRPRPPTVLPDRSGEGLRLAAEADAVPGRPHDQRLGAGGRRAARAVGGALAVAEQSAQVREGERSWRTRSPRAHPVRSGRRGRHSRPPPRSSRPPCPARPSTLPLRRAAIRPRDARCGGDGRRCRRAGPEAREGWRDEAEVRARGGGEPRRQAEYSGMSSRVP